MRISFDQVIELLREYKNEFGDLLVPRRYCTVTGVKLGGFVNSIRTGRRKITLEEKRKLDEMDFVWNVGRVLPFEKLITLLKEYKKEFGDLLVPEKYITADGVKLGSIVNSIRKGSRKTTLEEKRKLDEMGFVWKVERRVTFEELMTLLKEYKKEFGDLLVPVKYITVDGVKLGSIVSSIRSGTRKTTIEEKAKLDEMGFVWKCTISIEEVIQLLKDYERRYGDLNVPQNYRTATGINLGSILHNIKSGARKTTPEEKEKLIQLGLIWKLK